MLEGITLVGFSFQARQRLSYHPDAEVWLGPNVPDSGKNLAKTAQDSNGLADPTDSLMTSPGA